MKHVPVKTTDLEYGLWQFNLLVEKGVQISHAGSMRRKWRTLNDWANKYEVLMVLLLLVVILRLPSLMEPFWYGDENIYLAIGQSIRQREILYRDVTDYPNKPPAIYLLAAVTGSVTVLRAVLLVWTMTATAFFYYLTKRLTTKEGLRVGASLAWIILTCTPLIEGNIANAENFFIGPIVLGALWLVDARGEKDVKKRLRLSLLAGFSLGVALMFKIHVVFDVVALGLFFFVFEELKKFTRKSMVHMVTNKYMWIFGLGLAIPIGVTVVGLFMTGVSPMYLIQNAFGSSGYVSAWSQADWMRQTLGMGALEARAGLLVLVVACLFGWKNRLDKNLTWMSLWLVMALFAALLSARPYPHYLIQIVAPLILGVMVMLSLKKAFKSKLVFGSVVMLVILAFVRFGFGMYPVLGYYQNFIGLVSGKIEYQEYMAKFDARMPTNYRLAEVIRGMTNPNERIYIWGTEAEVYVLSGRLPEGPLVASFHVADLDYYDETIALIEQNQTPVIVVMSREKRPFPDLYSLLNHEYVLVSEVNDPREDDVLSKEVRARVYKRLSVKK